MGSQLARKGARIGSRALLVCLAILLLSLAFAPVQNLIEGATPHPHAARVQFHPHQVERGPAALNLTSPVEMP